MNVLYIDYDRSYMMISTKFVRRDVSLAGMLHFLHGVVLQLLMRCPHPICSYAVRVKVLF